MKQEKPHTLITQKTIRTGFFGKRIDRSAGKALVLENGRGSHTVLQPGQSLTRGEAIWGGFETAYEVDVSQLPLQLSCQLPTAHAAFHFQAEVSGSYHVSDASELVRHPVEDPVGMLLGPALIDEMRQVSREYKVDKTKEAEEAIRKRLDSVNLDVKPFAIRKLNVEVELDAATRERLAETEEAAQTIGREVRLEKLRQEREQARQAFRKMEQEHEIELQEIRLGFYQPLVEGGQWQILALQLSQNPADVERVAAMLQEAQVRQLETRMHLLDVAVENDALREYQLEESAIEVLRDVLAAARSFPGMPPGEKTREQIGDGKKEGSTQESAETSAQDRNAEGDPASQDRSEEA